MPNAFDKRIAEKAGRSQVPAKLVGYSNVPWRQSPANAIEYNAIAPTQAYQMEANRYAIDPYAERAMFREMVEQPDMRRYVQSTSPQALENPVGDIIRSTHERPDGTMSMRSNYAKWWDKLPRGKALMSLFNPAGVVENAVMEDTLGMPILDAIGAATGRMSPEDKARYEQMYYEQTGT